MEYFYDRFKANPNFIQNFTVLAVVDGKMYTQIQNAPCILYKNASGDLEMSKAKAHLEKDHVLPMIYKKCYKFLMEIHKHGIYYGDIKCKNIFVNIENNSQEITARDILIGDYGSLRSYDSTANSIINNYVFTFMTPMSESFVEFWRPGGRGYNYGVRTRLREISKNDPRINYIFSTETLRKVKETWQNVYNDYVASQSFQVINNPCLTCPLLCAQIESEFGFSISRQLVHLILKQNNFSFKRIRKRGFSKQKEEKTKTFIEQFKQNNKHSTTIISIDESGFEKGGLQL